MITDFYIEPESEEEVELIELLSVARDYGQDETDMEDREIAILFNQFAVGLLQPGHQEDEQEIDECPSCGQVMSDVEVLGMGMDGVVQPCGCEVSFEDLDESWYISDG